MTLSRYLMIALLSATTVLAQSPRVLTNSTGVRLVLDERADSTSLKALLPNQPDSDPGIRILVPEHVTAKPSERTEALQLYMSTRSDQPRREWHTTRNSFDYRMSLPMGIGITARVTLEGDGIRFRYDFSNHSSTRFDMIYAVTDPRMVTPAFRDVRLERTYIHDARGFELLAAEWPERTTEPLDAWLPSRVRAPYTWPLDKERTAKQPDGITWYNRSSRVDEPLIATKSVDGKWIMASFSYDPGNVWSNPELTCQHTDPQISLEPGQTKGYEVKILIIRGTLDDVLRIVRQERPGLQH